MDMFCYDQQERCRIEVYCEYLRKIPQLLQQLDTVETMYQKAVLEQQMLQDKNGQEESVRLYADRLERTREQCLLRAADIREQCRLIFALKQQIERESPLLSQWTDR